MAVAVLLAAVTAHRSRRRRVGGIWPPFRALPSFLIGVSLFYWRDALRRISTAGAILALSLPVMVVAMTTGTPDIVTLMLVYVVAGSAMAADVRGSYPSAVRRFAPLGQLTYSIYMWHSILIMVFMNAIGDRLLHAGTGLMLVVGAACYATIFVISCISFAFIETPAHRWIDSLKLFSTTDRARTRLCRLSRPRIPRRDGEALPS